MRKNYDIWRPFWSLQLLFSTLGTRRVPIRIPECCIVWLSSCAVPIRRELRNCLCFNVAELFDLLEKTLLALGVRTVHPVCSVEVR
jgi:hypothetical protein